MNFGNRSGGGFRRISAFSRFSFPNGEYRKVREALEFIMPIVESMDPEDLNKKMFEKRKKELSIPTGLPPC